MAEDSHPLSIVLGATMPLHSRSRMPARTGRPTAICVHRPVLPHILDALEMAPATLVTGEFLVAHLTGDGSVHAVERHRPQA